MAEKATKETAEAPKKKAAAKAPAKAESATAAKQSGKQTEGAGGTLKIHHLRPAPGAKKAKTRVGRGEASKGKTAGRGTKGTKARYQVPERFEGGQMPLHMRLPKLRGFKNPFRTEYQVVNLDKLAALYPEGGQMPLHMRLPKLKGFKNPFKTEYQVVNLDKLASLYPEGGEVTVEEVD